MLKHILGTWQTNALPEVTVGINTERTLSWLSVRKAFNFLQHSLAQASLAPGATIPCQGAGSAECNLASDDNQRDDELTEARKEKECNHCVGYR